MLGELKPTKTKHDWTRQTHIETHYSQTSKKKIEKKSLRNKKHCTKGDADDFWIKLMGARRQ